jgi:hypothetical protein
MKFFLSSGVFRRPAATSLFTSPIRCAGAWSWNPGGLHGDRLQVLEQESKWHGDKSPGNSRSTSPRHRSIDGSLNAATSRLLSDRMIRQFRCPGEQVCHSRDGLHQQHDSRTAQTSTAVFLDFECFLSTVIQRNELRFHHVVTRRLSDCSGNDLVWQPKHRAPEVIAPLFVGAQLAAAVPIR